MPCIYSTRDDLLQTVLKYVSLACQEPNVEPSTSFTDDLQLTTLGYQTLVAGLENMLAIHGCGVAESAEGLSSKCDTVQELSDAVADDLNIPSASPTPSTTSRKKSTRQS